MSQEDLAAAELASLKERAKKMGITHSGNIGVDALKAKIQAKMDGEKEAPASDENEDDDDSEELNPLAGDVAGEKPAAKLTLREQIRRDALKMVRVRITNMDPKKANVPGEIFTVGNRYVGTVKKFIPFGETTEDGYHIPHILYENLRDRKFLHIRVIRDKNTKQERVETSWQREFSLEVLPQLTPKELAQLANAQMAANNS